MTYCCASGCDWGDVWVWDDEVSEMSNEQIKNSFRPVIGIKVNTLILGGYWSIFSLISLLDFDYKTLTHAHL